MDTGTHPHWAETLRDGSRVLVRPIEPGDEAAEREFIRGLSERSRRMRFLGQLSCPSDEELAGFTHMDEATGQAFVAICEDDGRMVGAARYARDADGQGCECAVAVADEWQGIGLGVALMRRLVEAARAHGLRSMRSVDFAANTEMQQLAHFLGFRSHRDRDDPGMVVHELALQ